MHAPAIVIQPLIVLDLTPFIILIEDCHNIVICSTHMYIGAFQMCRYCVMNVHKS